MQESLESMQERWQRKKGVKKEDLERMVEEARGEGSGGRSMVREKTNLKFKYL